MKKGRKVQYILNPNNVEALNERFSSKDKGEAYYGLLRLCAEICDHAVQGEDIYFTLGMTRDRSGLLAVITWDGDKSFLAAGSLAGLADECKSWVELE